MSLSTELHATALLVALLVPIAPGGASAGETGPCTRATSERVLWGESVELLYEDEQLAPVVTAAVELWHACGPPGGAFPELVVGGPGTRPVSIEVRKLSPDDHCGTFSANRIVLYESARTGTGRILPCGSLRMNLAHELGHALGLADSPRQASCQAHIMARLGPGNLSGRAVQAEECAVVDGRWLTLAERGRSVPFGRPTGLDPVAAVAEREGDSSAGGTGEAGEAAAPEPSLRREPFVP